MKNQLTLSLMTSSTVLQSGTAVSANENNECTTYEPGSQANSRNKVIRTFKKKKKKKKINNKGRHKLFISKLTEIRNNGKKVSWMCKELSQQKEPNNGLNRKQSRGHCIYDRGKQCPLLPKLWIYWTFGLIMS